MRDQDKAAAVPTDEPIVGKLHPGWFVGAALVGLLVLAYILSVPEARKGLVELLQEPTFTSFLAAILVGLVTGVLSSFWVGKRVQGPELAEIRRHMKNIDNKSEDQRKAVSAVAESVEIMFGKYQRILDGLPEALGGEFTKSVLRYHPDTSGTIAGIVSDQTKRIFESNCRKTLVKDAVDAYLIQDPRPWEEDCYYWPLRFHVEWTWENDSGNEQAPLSDFRIIVAAAIEAIGSWDAGDKQKARKAYREGLKKYQNRVLASVPHPDAESPEKRLRLEDVGKLFRVERIEFEKKGQQKVTATVGDGLELSKDEIPGIYLMYEISEEKKRKLWNLKDTESMKVIYRGSTLAAVESRKRKTWGGLRYSPSDLVGGDFELKLFFPPAIHNPLAEGAQCKVGIDFNQSYCSYAHEAAEKGVVVQDSPEKNEFADEIGDDEVSLASLKWKEPLTDLHFLSMVWFAEEVPKARAGASDG